MTTRLSTALCLLLCLALVATGCGGDEGETTPGATTANGATGGDSGATVKSRDDAGGGSGGPDADGEGSGSKAVSGSYGEVDDPAEFKAPRGGDDSIQTYGTEVDEEEGEEIVAAMRSFFQAMATSDYPAICAGLTSSNREQLELFLKAKKRKGDCATVLKDFLLSRVAPEARRAARGAVFQVRVEDDNAFVLFRPAGGAASYFVMKNEDGRWRSTGLAVGTPFDPTAATAP